MITSRRISISKESKKGGVIMKLIIHGAPVKGNKIFGEDTEKVLTLCDVLYHRYLMPREYGYPFHPAIWVGNVHPATCPKGKWKECINNWMTSHPNEAAEYNAAKEAWAAETARMWRELFGIAKKKHVRIKWLGDGTCACPDQFLIYYQGDSIGMIQC